MQIMVEFPMLSAEFEFDIDEKKQLFVTVEEAIDAVCGAERFSLKGDLAQLLVLHAEKKAILNKYQNPVEAGVKDGDTLIIV